MTYVLIFQAQTFTLTNLNGVRPRQDLGQNGVEDMIQLRYVIILKIIILIYNLRITKIFLRSDLNEASLLWNLKIRYDRDLIYVSFCQMFFQLKYLYVFIIFIYICILKTYTGSILVAVNPYKMFDVYGLDQVKQYEGRILGTLPP